MTEPHPIYREFEDTENVRWRVWEVVPPGGERTLLGPRPTLRTEAPSDTGREADTPRRLKNEERRALWARGWLLFESAESQRRLMPIPDGWQTAPHAELIAMCRRAVSIPRR